MHKAVIEKNYVQTQVANHRGLKLVGFYSGVSYLHWLFVGNVLHEHCTNYFRQTSYLFCTIS